MKTLRLSLQLLFHILSLGHIFDDRDDGVFLSFSGIQIPPHMQPAQSAASRYGTKFRIHHAIILKHIPYGLLVSRNILRDNASFNLFKVFHPLYSVIAKHTEKSLVNENRSHFSVFILKEADSGYHIINHGTQVFHIQFSRHTPIPTTLFSGYFIVFPNFTDV